MRSLCSALRLPARGRQSLGFAAATKFGGIRRRRCVMPPYRPNPGLGIDCRPQGGQAWRRCKWRHIACPLAGFWLSHAFWSVPGYPGLRPSSRRRQGRPRLRRLRRGVYFHPLQDSVSRIPRFRRLRAKALRRPPSRSVLLGAALVLRAAAASLLRAAVADLAAPLPSPLKLRRSV